ncbi:MAG TPA: ammonium transporter [Dysgonamonadaceae bacterium]|jgi:Amt family ammonium transporter|uniref:ammonium transporter n=1 Tax=Seramator thermalis TaxID=2496270 RepID=UPI00101C0FAC|nr:ammonium transporter [Seramator thermalis]HOM62282.1 ammonium transporter [Dysgonamonadaceae bacterium]HQF11326.1 ammonium transporter [Paludibacteraceae bacterium]HPD43542.1 ammonium transporter [Dysgonamonadaceae bacterium]HQI43904.1 ammonium transporter [Dysgonamonadaceae bacterium]HRS41984.1 ammonium transporter [Dysgonamonadaceae bacterium]
MDTSTLSALNTVWVLITAVLVFFMQTGFALVETGFTRTKNTTNILFKNLIDFCIGSVVFWIIGYGLMYGNGSGFIGKFEWFSKIDHGASVGLPNMAFFFFQLVFAATASTIVSGAMAERTKFKAYLIYSLVISAIIYPVSGHWVWGGGWLSAMETPFHDFAGSTVVHSVGGWIALIGAAFLGPRRGKYKNGKAMAIPGHSLTLAALGVFILWVGWFGFNPGSTLGLSNPDLVANIFVTTNGAAAAGGIATLATTWLRYGKPTFSMTLNGVLAGLVAITAGCDVVTPGGAIIIGLIAGVLVVFAVEFFDKTVKIDDPVGAISVHGVCGAFGTLMVGFFSNNPDSLGILYGGNAQVLLSQLIGVVTVGGWAILCAVILFSLLKYTIGIRVTAKEEEIGLDFFEHGEKAYN